MSTTSTSTPAPAETSAPAAPEPNPRFTVTLNDLSAALTYVAKVVPLRPAVPILAGVMLTAGPSQVTVMAFDYEQARTVTLDTHGPGEVGRVLVPCTPLARMIAKMPKPKGKNPKPAYVIMESSGDYLAIECGSTRFRLRTLPVEDYPAPPEVPAVAGTVQAAVFGEAFAKVALVAGRDETLPMMTGVHVAAGKGKTLTLRATDRYRAAIRDIGWQPARNPTGRRGWKFAGLVPARHVADAAKLFAGLGGAVTIGVDSADGGLLRLQCGRYQLITRLLDGANYPPLHQLVPDERPRLGVVDAAKLAELADRLTPVMERATPLRMRFEADTLTLEAGGEEADGTEAMPVQFTGPTTTVGVNVKYLLDGLKEVGTAFVRFEFVDAYKAFLIVPLSPAKKPVPGYVHLLMPIRLVGAAEEQPAEEQPAEVAAVDEHDEVTPPGPEPGKDAATWSPDLAADVGEVEPAAGAQPLTLAELLAQAA